MEEIMNLICRTIRSGRITHSEAESWLYDACSDFGTEAVAVWLENNDKEVVKWLDQGAV